MCKIIVSGLVYYLIFHFFCINLGFLTPTWDFLEHNLGTSGKPEWKHWTHESSRESRRDGETRGTAVPVLEDEKSRSVAK